MHNIPRGPRYSLRNCISYRVIQLNQAISSNAVRFLNIVSSSDAVTDGGHARYPCTVSMHKGRSKRDFSKQTLEQCGTAWDEIQMRGIVKQSRSRLLGS